MKISLAPEILFYIGNFAVTNTILVSVATSIIILLFLLLARRKMSLVPKGVQFWAEVMLEEGYKFVEGVMGTERAAKRVFPYIATVFLFILTANLIPFVPGLDTITMNGVPLYRTATTDYNLVFMLTIISLVLVEMVAIVSGGIIKYVAKFINVKGPIAAFMGIMDLVGEFAKIISLSFRLFGNIFAGQVLSAVILFLAPFVIPLPFALLGLLAAVIQAAVFSILVLIFFSMAIETESV